ncbi:hypothetical protein GGF32_004789 [Allomyces javanicus]|nr:hypothetical protein GGF32_004789 [Allomyces javanicus]
MKDETVDYPPIPPNCRFLTIGPAKGTMSYLPPIPLTVETLNIEHLRPHYDDVFVSALFGDLPALKVFKLGVCSPIGVDRVVECLPRTRMRELTLKLTMDGREERSALMRLAKAMSLAVDKLKITISVERTHDYERELTDEADAHVALGQPGPATTFFAFRIPRELLSKLPAVRELHLYIPFFDAAVVSHFKMPKDVTHLALQQGYRGGPFLLALGPKLPKNLVSLTLNGIGPFGHDELAKGLFPDLPTSLESLTLTDNRLRLRHLAPCAARWPPNLHHLDLKMNKLDTLLTPLPPALRVLAINNNSLVENAARHVAWVRALPSTLQTLRINQNMPSAVLSTLLAHPPVRRRRNWPVKLAQRVFKWPRDASTAQLREVFHLIDGNSDFVQQEMLQMDGGRILELTKLFMPEL